MTHGNDVTSLVAGVGSDDESAKSSAEEAEKHDKTYSGHGPPSWAQQAHADKAKDKAWKDAWKELSPARKADLMKKLAHEHAEGMKAFSYCVEAGRSDCERPLPPGHAKRL